MIKFNNMFIARANNTIADGYERLLNTLQRKL